MTKEISGRIRVVRTPDGTAPSWVREAWKGLVLTCFPQVVCFSDDLFNSSDKDVGYVVAQRQAIDELMQHNQPAADWWQENWYGGDGGFFFFSTDDAEVVSGIPTSETRFEKHEMCIDA